METVDGIWLFIWDCIKIGGLGFIGLMVFAWMVELMNS